MYRDRGFTRAGPRGWSLVEIAVVVVAISTILAIALPVLTKARESANIGRAIADLSAIEQSITNYVVQWNKFPSSLTELRPEGFNDPWGRPYQYLNISDPGTDKSQARKDHFLVPVNSDYDLYSMGEDGATNAPFTAKASRDDIVPAMNGGFKGLVSDF